MANITTWNAYIAAASVLTTELNSLGSAARTNASAAQGADGTGGPLFGDFELALTYGTAPAAGATLTLYLLPAADGTNYPDGSSSVAPQPELAVGRFSARAVNTAQRLVLRRVVLPPGLWKAIVQNNGSQALSASGHTLKVRAYNINNNG